MCISQIDHTEYNSDKTSYPERPHMHVLLEQSDGLSLSDCRQPHGRLSITRKGPEGTFWEAGSLPTMQESQVWSLGQEDPLEKQMATHSSTLAWKIPWMEEPGRLQSMGLQRVRHDWAISLQYIFYIYYYRCTSKCIYISVKIHEWYTLKSILLLFVKCSLMAQLIKIPLAMWEAWVQSLGWEDPLEKGKYPLQYSPVFWPGEFHGPYSPWGCKESDTTEQLLLHTLKTLI